MLTPEEIFLNDVAQKYQGTSAVKVGSEVFIFNAFGKPGTRRLSSIEPKIQRVSSPQVFPKSPIAKRS